MSLPEHEENPNTRIDSHLNIKQIVKKTRPTETHNSLVHRKQIFFDERTRFLKAKRKFLFKIAYKTGFIDEFE